MVKRVLVFTGIFIHNGTGNVLRMISLVGFLQRSYPEIIFEFTTNDEERFKKLDPTEDVNLVSLSKLLPQYSLVLYDSGIELPDVLMRLQEVSGVVVAFDYFNYSSGIPSILINLYNHFPKKASAFGGKIYQGPAYAIINEKILEAYDSKSNGIAVGKALVTFGGEDPKGNTTIALEKLKKAGVEAIVLIGKLNKSADTLRELYADQFMIVDYVNNIGNYYNSADFIICGGGTSLLEALYFGKPVISMGQNQLEVDFINYIGKSVRLFDIDELEEVTRLIENKDQLAVLAASSRLCVDGMGKARIGKIIYEQFH